MTWGGLSRSIRHQLVERATLTVLCLPVVIFFAGWLRPLVALPALGVLLYAIYRAMHGPAPVTPPSMRGATAAHSVPPVVALLVLLAICVFIVAFSGIGGFAPNGAQSRHNAFLRDLIEYPWPLAYKQTTGDHQPRILAFYLGNELVPGLFGRIFGWAAANVFSVVWGALGLFLATCLFLGAIGRVTVGFGLLFLFAGGLDIVGYSIFGGWERPLSNLNFFQSWMASFSGFRGHHQMANIFWITPSTIPILQTGPHHAYGSWFALLLILRDVVRSRSCRRMVFVWSCTLLWSPFSFVGTLPFLGLAVLTTRARGLLSFENTLGSAVVLGLTGAFITSNNNSFPSGFLWEYQNVLVTAPVLVLFYILSFGVYWVAMPDQEMGLPHSLAPAWLWQWGTIAVQLALPWYRLGKFNDLAIKGSMPAFVVMLVLLATAIRDARTDVQRRSARILIALLMLGSLGGAVRLLLAVNAGVRLEPLSKAHVTHVDEVGMPPENGRLLFASPDAFFWRTLAKPAEFQAPAHPH